MATLKMGSTTMLTESSGALTVNASNPTVTLGSNTTFPTGHVIQTISDTYVGVNSDTMSGTSTLTRVETGSNVYNWKGTINNVDSSNWVNITMSFEYHMAESGAADFGGDFGIHKNETGEIYGAVSGNAHRFLYFHEGNSDNFDYYATASIHMVDKSPVAGTNIYYLSYSNHGATACEIQSTSSAKPFICTLQEIKQ